MLRVHLHLRPEEASGPLVAAYPFWVDVRLPAGGKTFDIPAGRSPRSHEATPAVASRLLALSGHMHDHATGLRFENATTGEVIWEAAPVLDDEGRTWSGFRRASCTCGADVVRLEHTYRLPEHTYRLTVEYANATGRPIPDGGMGSAGGIVVPVGGESSARSNSPWAPPRTVWS